MPVKSTQEVGERGRRNGDGPRFARATTTAAARHRWTTAPGGRAPRPVKATHGKQRTRCQSSAAAAHGPRRRCWTARGDVGGPQNAASGGGVGRAMRHARRRRQQAAGCFAGGRRLHLLAHRGGTTASATAVVGHPNLRRRNAKPRRRAACGWCVKLGFQKGAVVRVQQRSAGKPLRRETYERKRRVLGAD